MIVLFDNLDDYLTELKSRTGRSIVRAHASRSQVNDGVAGWSVSSGFHDENYYYELTLDCGEDYAGGKSEGQSAAEAAVEKIKAFCEEHGYDFGGGMWCRPE